MDVRSIYMWSNILYKSNISLNNDEYIWLEHIMQVHQVDQVWSSYLQGSKKGF